MVLGLRGRVMGLFMRVNMLMGGSLGRGGLCGRTGVFMKGSFRIIICMGRGCTFGLIIRFMMGSGLITRCMGSVLLNFMYFLY
jgi:hypothetical protein